MKKIRQFNVGNVTIRKEGEELFFDGYLMAKNPQHVMIAILTVSKYLKWHDGPFTNYVLMECGGTKTATQKHDDQAWYHVWLGDVGVNEAIWKDGKKPYVASVTTSSSGHTIYVAHKEVMHICSTGNTNWCRIFKKQLIGAINDWYYNKNYTLIPEFGFSILPMFKVEKTEAYVEFDADDFEQADKKFLTFMQDNCKEAGSYSFANEEFRKGTGLPTRGLVWHYLTNRHEFARYNGLTITSASQNDKTVELTLALV